MFYGCTSLKEIPATLFPVTPIPTNGYPYMFYGCIGLTEIQVGALVGTSIEINGCDHMFQGCTGLKEIPAAFFPAYIGSSSCQYMFQGCTDLQVIYMTIDWFNERSSQYQMFKDCPNISIQTSYADIPAGWK
jgi:hypothetical protein